MMKECRRNPARVKSSPNAPTIRCAADVVVSAAKRFTLNGVNDEARADVPGSTLSWPRMKKRVPDRCP
jgi:hypothetical protein